MATKEEISMVGFEIVAYAGDAQTDLLAALDAAREGDFEKAEQLHKDASDALIGAHDTQTKLLSQEAGGCLLYTSRLGFESTLPRVRSSWAVTGASAWCCSTCRAVPWT